MKILSKSKDGGPLSPVDGYFLFEIKGLCSMALLKFNKGRREEFHTHAFNALTWFLSGDMEEEDITGTTYAYKKSLVPKITKRDKNHRVKANSNSWCFTLRGPWEDKWTEHNKKTKKTVTMTHGRIIIGD